MSLLDRMRSGTDSTLMQIVLGAVVVSFVWFWGKPPGQNEGGNAAVVDGEVIPDIEFRRLYGRVERNQEDRLDRGLTDAESARLREEVLAGMVEEKVMEHAGERFGLQVADGEVTRRILANPMFHDKGKFSIEQYREVLKRMGTSEVDYELGMRDELMRARAAKLVGFLGVASEAEARQVYIDAQTKIDVGYVRIPPLRFGDDVDVGEAALATFVTENKPAIESSYKDDFERLYKIPDKASLELITLTKRDDGVTLADLEARLTKIRDEISGGADFATLARRWSEHTTAGAGGVQDEIAVRDLEQAVQDAIAKLEPGQVSAVVKDAAQVRLYRLVRRTPGREVPLEEATPDIAKRLLRDREAPRLAAAYAEKVLAAWKQTGTAPIDLLVEKGFDVRSSGPVAADDLTGPSAPPKRLVAAARDGVAGAALPEVYEEAGVYWVGALTSRQTADPTAFEAEKANVVAQVTLAKRALTVSGWRKAEVAAATVKK